MAAALAARVASLQARLQATANTRSSSGAAPFSAAAAGTSTSRGGASGTGPRSGEAGLVFGGASDGAAVPIRGLAWQRPTVGGSATGPAPHDVSGAGLAAGGSSGAASAGGSGDATASALVPSVPAGPTTAARATNVVALAQYWPKDGLDDAQRALPVLLATPAGAAGEAGTCGPGSLVPSAAAQQVAAAEARVATFKQVASAQGQKLRASAGAGLKPVVDAMAAHVANAAVAGAGCAALRTLASKLDAKDAGDRKAAVEALDVAVTAARLHVSSPDVLAAAHDALRALAAIADVAETCAAGLEAAVAAVHARTNGPATVLEPAVREVDAALVAAVNEGTAVQTAVSGSVIEALVGVMHVHRDAPNVALAACSTLCRLLASPIAPQAVVPRCLSAGAGAALLEVLRGQVGNAPSVAAASDCLQLLSTAMPPQAAGAAIPAADAVTLLVAALRAQGGVGECAQHAAAALRCVMSNNQNAKALAASAGALEALVAASLRHPRSMDVQAACCGALKSLAVDDNVRLRDAAEAAVEALIAALTQHGRHNAKLSEDGCGALCNLTVGSGENAHAVGDAGGIVAIVAVMSAWPDNADVAEAGCAALWAVAAATKDAGLLARLAKDGGVDALVQSLHRHVSSVAVHTVALAGLKHAALHSSANQVAVAGSGGLEAVIHSLAVWGNNPSLQVLGFETLAAVMASHPAIQRWAFQAGAVDVVQAALETRWRDNKEVTKAAGKVANLMQQQRGLSRLCGFDTVN